MPGIRVYPHSDLEGTSAYWVHTGEFRYLRIGNSILGAYGLHDNISSFWVNAREGDERETAILFEHAHFKGRFVAFAGSYPANIITILEGEYDFNDRTSSILLVAHARTEFITINLGQIARDQATDMIDEMLSGISDASRRGALEFTWEMWPSFDSGKKFVRLNIPLSVQPALKNYDARITYFIYLYIDASHRLRGYVNWVEIWVESGILSGSIASNLITHARDAADEVDDMLNDALTELDFHEWRSYYLMPGLAPLALPASYQGNVTDDVSVVLVNR